MKPYTAWRFVVSEFLCTYHEIEGLTRGKRLVAINLSSFRMDLEATFLAFAGLDAVVEVTIHADVSIPREHLQGNGERD